MAQKRKVSYRKKPYCRRCGRMMSANASIRSLSHLCGVCVRELYPDAVQRGMELNAPRIGRVDADS